MVKVVAFTEVAVSLNELKVAVSRLSSDELTAFARWFADHVAEAWGLSGREFGCSVPRIVSDEPQVVVEADCAAEQSKLLSTDGIP